MAKRTEWRLEPTDDAGDIIDPQFYGNEAAAMGDVARMFAEFDGAVYVDLCRVDRYGNTDEGVTDEVYEYVTRQYRDGRVVALTTERGTSPVEAS